MATGVVLLDWSGLSAEELAAATMLPEFAVQKSSTAAGQKLRQLKQGHKSHIQIHFNICTLGLVLRFHPIKSSRISSLQDSLEGVDNQKS